jgi:Xaa-Pro aminopeptidase
MAISASNPATPSFSARLASLRAHMAQCGMGAYLLPVNDATLGEMPAPHARRLEWLTGFSGSAGIVVVTTTAAALFVDGRYTLQAPAQVDNTLFEIYNSGERTPMQWLAEQVHAPLSIGYDAWLFSHAQIQRMTTTLRSASEHAIAWCADTANMVDAVWSDRPVDPLLPGMPWPIAYAGLESTAKRSLLAETMDKAGMRSVVLANPESVCWLLNVRGADLPTTPQLNAAALITRTETGVTVAMCVASEKLKNVVNTPDFEGVSVYPWEELPVLAVNAVQPLALDGTATPRAVTLALESAAISWVAAEDPCLLLRACKHPIEQHGMRQAHQRDGVALIRFLAALDHQLAHAPAEAWPTELDVVAQLRGLREQGADFWGDSFDTIAGFGPNGAIVHYRPELSTNLRLQAGSLLLLDSGGQYPMGTTDVTRTLAIGTPTEAMRAHFTRVLQGHIGLAMARFPKGTTGSQLDALARQWLWRDGLDYDHGTGHGVGTFLNVHEGPQRISKRGGDQVALRPGMVVSNEPGYYLQGSHGIRIENLVLVVATETDGFLAFETLTCAPIDKRLVVAEWLTHAQRQWWNSYHAWVLETQSPHVNSDVRAWLEAACTPL